MSCPDSSNSWSIRHEAAARMGIRDPLWSSHFILKNCDTFTRTSVTGSKLNNIARTQLAFQMLTLQTTISIPPEPVFQNMREECLVPIAQIATAFDVNLNVRRSRPPMVEPFSVSETSALSQEYSVLIRNWMLLPGPSPSSSPSSSSHSWHFKC